MLPVFLPRLAAALLLLASLLGMPAHADERYNQVSLQAQAHRNVAHDLMRVSLYSERQGADPAKLAAETTRVLNEATAKARQAQAVSVQSGSRTSAPVYDKDRRRIVAWRERAELQLESTDFAALAELAAALQGEMKIAGQYFLISTASRKANEDSLIEQAIAAFRARAQLATQALGGKSYRLISLNLDSAGFRPIMAQRAVSFMAADSAEAQQISAGTSEVVITAAGVIEIQM